MCCLFPGVLFNTTLRQLDGQFKYIPSKNRFSLWTTLFSTLLCTSVAGCFDSFGSLRCVRRSLGGLAPHIGNSSRLIRTVSCSSTESALISS